MTYRSRLATGGFLARLFAAIGYGATRHRNLATTAVFAKPVPSDIIVEMDRLRFLRVTWVRDHRLLSRARQIPLNQLDVDAICEECC